MNDESTKQAETALIGSLLKNPAQYPTIRDAVTATDFHDMGFRAIWEAFGELYEAGMSIDTVTVGDMLDRKGNAQDVAYGGFTARTAVNRIRDDGDRGNAESYAVNVRDYSAKRQMVEEFSKGANWASNGRHAADIQADMIKKLALISVPNRMADKHTQTIKESLSDAWDEANQPKSKVKTGFIDLDALLGGMYAPDLLIIAARPGQGKTVFLDNVAYNVSLAGKKVAFFTLEMSNVQNTMRLIQMISGVSYEHQREGKMTSEEWVRYNDAVEHLGKLQIYFCDLPAIKPNQIRKTLRTLESKYGKMDLIIVDYLQLAAPDEKQDNRTQDVGYVSHNLKAICKEFGVPLFAAAQLSRGAETRAEKRPILSDLRESGDIEADADVVAFIHKDATKANIVEIIVAKHRNGPVGSVELIFRSALTKFENAATKYFNPNGKDYADV